MEGLEGRHQYRSTLDCTLASYISDVTSRPPGKGTLQHIVTAGRTKWEIFCNFLTYSFAKIIFNPVLSVLLFAFVTCRLVGNGFLSKPPGNGYLLKQSICSPPLQGPSTNIDLSEKRSLLSPKWVCLTAVLIQAMRTQIYFDISRRQKEFYKKEEDQMGCAKITLSVSCWSVKEMQF